MKRSPEDLQYSKERQESMAVILQQAIKTYGKANSLNPPRHIRAVGSHVELTMPDGNQYTIHIKHRSA